MGVCTTEPKVGQGGAVSADGAASGSQPIPGTRLIHT
jgi:hypothetical protein